MAPGDGPPLSLRPYPVADKKPKNLAEFIARVNGQPGGFRSVTETKLHDDIRAQEERSRNGIAEDDDIDMSDGEDNEDGDAAWKDPQVARIEVLKNIDIAGNTALLTLDTLSLLLSKQNPTQAGVTLSQQLREMVGIGTIGADKLDDSNVTAEKTEDQSNVAVGWTLMEINKTRDAADEASAFLQREMTAEGKYWEEVMAVQKSGWSISKVPQERHTLGVRFGFSEAAPEFRVNGLAPMRRGDDGSVQLDCGRLGGVSERIVVTYEKDGKVVGRSAVPAQTAEDAPLEARVLEARNTIFSQELWHEIRREARSLAAYDVKPQGSQLTCTLDPTSKINIEFVTLGDQSSPPDESLSENNIAETISLTLYILLSYSHRHNELMRIRPMPPHIPRSRGQQTYTLLRPIIARLTSIKNIQSCTQYIGALIQALQKAGLPSSFVLRTPQSFSFDPSAVNGPNQPSSTQALIRNILQPLDFSIKITLLPDIDLTVRGRTFLFPFMATYYTVVLPPSSPLTSICAPYKDGYPDLTALADYLRTVTARVLTENYLAKLVSTAPEPPPGEKKAQWTHSVRGSSISDPKREDFEIRFAIDDIPLPALAVSSTALVNGKPESKKWRWASTGESETASLDGVIGRVADQDLS